MVQRNNKLNRLPFFIVIALTRLPDLGFHRHEWNLLTEDVVSAGSLNTFKARLGHHLRNVRFFYKDLPGSIHEDTVMDGHRQGKKANAYKYPSRSSSVLKTFTVPADTIPSPNLFHSASVCLSTDLVLFPFIAIHELPWLEGWQTVNGTDPPLSPTQFGETMNLNDSSFSPSSPYSPF